MTHRFKLIKGREEFDLDPELFNHVDGRQVIAFLKDSRFFLGCYCISRSGHYWVEEHFENRDQALEDFLRRYYKTDRSWTALIDLEKAFSTKLA